MKEERVGNQLKHFKTLLGKNDAEENNEEDREEEMEVEKVLTDLNIEDGLFSHSELCKAKRV